MASGNVSSYARVLIGPMQLDKITSARRKQQEKIKADKEMEAISKQNQLARLCKAHVDQGLDHVLSLTVKQRKNKLRYHYQMAAVDIDDTRYQ